MTHHEHDPTPGSLKLTPEQAEYMQEKLAERDTRVAEEARRSVRPSVIDLAELRRIGEKYRREEPAATPTAQIGELNRTTIYYRLGGAEEYSVRNGEWVTVNQQTRDFRARQPGPTQWLEVRDIAGATVVDHPTYGRIIQRGCLVCGVRDVVRPPRPIRFGKWWGSMCAPCHSRWEAETVSGRKQLGLFIARMLERERLLPGDFPRDHTGHGFHPIQHWPRNWSRFSWGGRVLRSERPEQQEPGSEPFFFLPGPITWAEGAEPEEVKA